MPTLSETEMNQISDDVVALYNGKRGPRKCIVDPANFSSDGSGWWLPNFDIAEALSAGGKAVMPLHLAEGDRVTLLELSGRQDTAAAITMTVFEISTSGVRTSKGSVSTLGAAVAQIWDTEQSGALTYVVPADVTVCVEISAGAIADLFGGGFVEVDHP